MRKRMQGRSMRGAAMLLAAMAAGLALGALGCGDNSGNPTGYVPEGQVSPAILLTDVQPFNADTSQVFVQMLVAAPPPSDGMRFYVSPNNEGFRPATESPIPSSTTFDSGWSFFQSSLDGYDPTTTSMTLMARGARGGIESTSAPVTSQGTILAADALTLARREEVIQTFPADSTAIPNLSFAWATLPGATSYMLQAFNASTGELGLLVYFNDATKSTTELEVSVLPFVPYRWQVFAYDGGGRAIGISDQRLFGLVPPDDAVATSHDVRVTVGATQL